MVSSSGSPAATSEPKASTMMAIVTGQERSSDFIIADLFAVLNSLQMAGEPVSATATDGLPARSSCGLSASAAATIAVGSPFAPAVTTAVWPSAEMVAPGRGRCTEATRASPASTRSTSQQRRRGTRARRSSRTGSGRRPSAPSSIARRSSVRSASGPAPTRSRPPAIRRRRAPSRPSGRTPRGRWRRSPTRRRSLARGRPRSRRAGRSGRRPARARHGPCRTLDLHEGRHAGRRYGRRALRSSGVRPIFRRLPAAVRPCFIANRLARARLETPIFA